MRNTISISRDMKLRKWRESDAESLFEYAKNPDIGPIAGWPPHKSVEESLNVIKTVFNGAECYAICEKENEKAIGAIELILNGRTDMTERHVICRKTTIFWMSKWKNRIVVQYVYQSELSKKRDCKRTVVSCYK